MHAMEKVKKKIGIRRLPVSKIVMLYPAIKPPFKIKATEPAFRIYPKVQMPLQSHGYLKVNESDCL